ncbi:MAG: hypothetical protein GY797_24160 [Deltaproteobacteria bacterium]|nr:hypothetical protein [Candidatus Brocadiaceae bacterium]MCP4371181.1 hypothetical protein [Deltaproteobacteria bacterium]
MELQGRDIEKGMRGDDIGLLQREFGQLDLGTPQIPQGEIQDQQFDDGTDLAVRTFQERYGLPVTGVVDEATARRINTKVDRIREGKFIIRGYVRYLNGQPVDMRPLPELLFEVKTDVIRYFEGFYTAEQFALARECYISSYDASYLDLTMRNGIPIATQDNGLKNAAKRCNVALFIR